MMQLMIPRFSNILVGVLHLRQTTVMLLNFAIYFRDIREADTVAKINRRENLILPL